MANLLQSQNRIKGILTGEPNPSNGTEPTPAQDGDQNTEKKVDVSSEQEVKSKAQETPKPKGQSDTETPSRRRKAKLGDREIEFDILTEDVDLDLIPKGMMMEWDYQKKSQNLSKEREVIEEKKAKLDQTINDLAEMLAYDAKRLESEEMQELKDSNPEAYWAEFNKVKSRAEKYQESAKKRREELQKKQQDFIQNEKSQYSQVIPEWLDDEVMSKDLEAIQKTIVKSGFSEDEAGAIYDRRLVSLMRKAMLYDRIQAQNIESKRVKETAPKPVSSNAKNVHEAKSNKIDELRSRQRQKKSGNIRESQALIKQILGG